MKVEKVKLTFFKYVDVFCITNKFNEILSVFGEQYITNKIAEAYHSKLNINEITVAL